MDMTQLGGSPLSQEYGSFRLDINVQPYPKLGDEIKDQDYRMEISVSRK